MAIAIFHEVFESQGTYEQSDRISPKISSSHVSSIILCIIFMATGPFKASLQLITSGSSDARPLSISAHETAPKLR